MNSTTQGALGAAQNGTAAELMNSEFKPYGCDAGR